MANALVRADALSHLFNIYAKQLAQVSNLVDKGDTCCEESIGRVLGHLRCASLHAQDAVMIAYERLVQLPHGALCVAVVGAYDDSVRTHEIINGGTLLQKFRVAHYAVAPAHAPALAMLIDNCLNAARCADRGRGFADDNCLPFKRTGKLSGNSEHLRDISGTVTR